MAYLVIVNRGEHSGYITEVNPEDWWSNENPDGMTEQAICGSHGQIYGEHETESAAQDELVRYLECKSAESGSYCYTHNPAV